MGAPYSLYKISEWLSRNIPRRWAYCLGRLVSMLVFVVSARERRAVKRNVSRFHKISYRNPQTNQKASEIYKNFSRYYVDLLYESRNTKKNILDCINISGVSVIDEVLKRSKGAIVLSAHVGNWEIGAMAIAAMNYPLSVIAYQHKDPRVNRFFVERRTAFGISVIPARNAVRKALKALNKNEILAINGDRRYSSDGGARVRFFGQTAIIPKGPAYLSLKSGAGIIGARLVPEDGTSRYSMSFSEPIYPDGMEINDYIQKAALLMEPMIDKNPSQWFAFEDIWPNGNANMHHKENYLDVRH